MIVIAIVPLLVAVVGLLMWFVSGNGKVQELGRLLFFCGALVTLFVMGGKVVRIGT